MSKPETEAVSTPLGSIIEHTASQVLQNSQIIDGGDLEAGEDAPLSRSKDLLRAYVAGDM